MFMTSLRIYRGFSTLVKRHPIIDRPTACIKGENLRNVLYGIKINELRLLSFCSGVTLSGENYCTTPKIEKKINPITPMMTKLSFSTSKIQAKDVITSSDLKKAIDHLTDQFMETRELLEDARESVDTVYFSSDMEEASESVKETLKQYQGLITKLSDEQRQEVLRTIGLKMEELKAQLQALEDH